MHFSYNIIVPLIKNTNLYLYFFLFFSSSSENAIYDCNVLQLPAADEPWVQLMCKKFIKAASFQNNGNNHSNFISENGLQHWTHEGHHLQLNNSNELKTLQEDDEVMLCDGCVQPIAATDEFYSCVTCKYVLHMFCAEFPKQIKSHLSSGMLINIWII